MHRPADPQVEPTVSNESPKPGWKAAFAFMAFVAASLLIMLAVA